MYVRARGDPRWRLYGYKPNSSLRYRSINAPGAGRSLAQLPAPTPRLPSFSAASCAAAQLTANGQFVSVNSINLIQHALSKIKPSINPETSDLPCLLHSVGISSSSPRHASMWSQGCGGAHQAASVPSVGSEAARSGLLHPAGPGTGTP